MGYGFGTYGAGSYGGLFSPASFNVSAGLVFAGGQWYSRFWVVLGPSIPWGPLTMPFTLGGNTTLGSTAKPSDVAAVKAQIQKWRSGHSYPVGVILEFQAGTLLGIGLKMPFTLGAGGRCFWPIGELLGSPQTQMPFKLNTFLP